LRPADLGAQFPGCPENADLSGATVIAPGTRQVTNRVLMVRPRTFGSNPETAESNAFQRPSTESGASLQAQAAREFDQLHEALTAEGVSVDLIEDTDIPAKPDAVFPNNWFSTHDDGTLVLYPMASRNRRAERRAEIVEHLCGRFGYCRDRLIDLSVLEDSGLSLEGTGSLVMERRRLLAYACLSPRTSEGALAEFSRRTGFEVIAFHARDERGVPLYHTNVMMSLGESFALACFDAIDPAQRGLVRERLAGHCERVIGISRAQMRGFAGNVLELAGRGATVVAMSARARASLSPAQLSQLAERGRVVSVSIPTIEKIGGGSVRCMLAELFTPRLSP
jgi:hypothetical protein